MPLVVIATSGIDYNIKLWEPVAERAASLDNLDEVRDTLQTVLLPPALIHPSFPPSDYPSK